MRTHIEILIDSLIDEMASSAYNCWKGHLDAQKLINTVINRLGMCDEEALSYIKAQVVLWHDQLELSCELEGCQSATDYELHSPLPTEAGSCPL